MTRCDDIRLLLGSFAIGGLEPDESAQVERHLSTCAACRQVRDELAPLPALLDLLEPGPMPAASPPRELEESVLAGFAAHHRAPPRRAPRRPRRPFPRWRVALPSALAGGLACLALLAVTGLLPSRITDRGQVTLSAAAGTGGASADAKLRDTDTGTEIELDAKLPPLRPGEAYELWFVNGNGRVSAGTFTVAADGRADVRLATAARAGTYERLGITREPDALDPARNGPSVVVGAVRG